MAGEESCKRFELRSENTSMVILCKVCRTQESKIINGEKQMANVLFSQYNAKHYREECFQHMMLSMLLSRKDGSSITHFCMKWINSFSMHFVSIHSGLSTGQSQNMREQEGIRMTSQPLPLSP